MNFQGSCGDTSQVVTGDFGPLAQPLFHCHTYGIGGCLGAAFGRSDAEASGNNTAVQLVS
ncbi:MAG TPA: hypothetical protein PKD28_04355 [Candidatus Saccharibacteria bacterium]|nr:hypothetical protein [Candidatus Saccharibacteria bacterium]